MNQQDGGKQGVLASAFGSPSREYTIDELAREAGTTVRNVRAYQDRGVIPPPERRGRSGIYSDAHLVRLKVIGRLLDRGYSLSNIAELISGFEKGYDIGQLLGVEQAVSSPWTDELPGYISPTELLKRYHNEFSPDNIKRALQLGILKREGKRFRVPSPRLLYAGQKFVEAGLPLSAMLDVLEKLRANVEQAADDMVELFANHVLGPDYLDKGKAPDADQLPHVADLIWKMRPLVEMAVLPEVSRAMEKAANQRFGDLIAYFLEYHQPPADSGQEAGNSSDHPAG